MGNVIKGKLGDLKFQINPTEVSVSVGGNYSEITAPGMKNPIHVYGSGNNKVISFDLYLNARHMNKLPYTIQTYLDTFSKYANEGEVVVFTYMGKSQKVLVYSYSANIMSLDSELNPTEATISLELKEYY